MHVEILFAVYFFHMNPNLRKNAGYALYFRVHSVLIPALRSSLVVLNDVVFAKRSTICKNGVCCAKVQHASNLLLNVAI